MGNRRVTLTLPEDLWSLLKSHIPKRKISQFIAEVAADRLGDQARARLRERLKQQCVARADEDLRIAAEFSAAESEAGRRVKR